MMNIQHFVYYAALYYSLLFQLIVQKTQLRIESMNDNLRVKFYKALRESDIRNIDACIRQGVNIEDRISINDDFDNKGVVTYKTNPILYAASYGNVKIFNYLDSLLRSKHFPDTLFSKLRRSIYGNDNAEALYLENFRVEHYTILHAAAAGGKLELVQKAVEKYKIAPNAFKGIAFKRYDDTNGFYGLTPLVLAVANDKRDVVKYLLQKGATISSMQVTSSTGQNYKIYSSLSCAIRNNNLPMVEFLIENGADINLPDHDSYSPLLLAIENNFQEIAKYLIKAGANVNVVGSRMPLLHMAVKQGSTEICALLLERGAKINEKYKFARKDCDYFTAFQYAIYKNNREIVDLFLNRFKDYIEDIQKKEGVRLEFLLSVGLLFAVYNDNEDMVHLLLQNGANPYFKYYLTGGYKCSIEVAVSSKKILRILYEETDASIMAPKAPKYFWEEIDKETGEFADPDRRTRYFKRCDKLRFLRAVRIGDIRELSTLCKTSDRTVYFDINESLEEGNTFLHIACMHGNLASVQFLLNQAADINAINQSGETPLISAIHIDTNSALIIKALLNHGARHDVSDMLGKTPLMHAIEENNKAAFDLLSNQKLGLIDLDERDNEGNTLLMMAISSGSLYCFKKLLKLDIFINAVNRDKENALMIAARSKENSMAKLLLENGASIDSINKAKKTAFDISLENKNFELCISLISAQILFLIANKQIQVKSHEPIEYIAKHAGSLRCRDKNQYSLLQVAVHAENTLFSEYLLKKGLSVNENDIEIANEINDNHKYNFDDVKTKIKNFVKNPLSSTQKGLIKKMLDICEPAQPNKQRKNAASKSYTPLRNATKRNVASKTINSEASNKKNNLKRR